MRRSSNRRSLSTEKRNSDRIRDLSGNHLGVQGFLGAEDADFAELSDFVQQPTVHQIDLKDLAKQNITIRTSSNCMGDRDLASANSRIYSVNVNMNELMESSQQTPLE